MPTSRLDNDKHSSPIGGQASELQREDFSAPVGGPTSRLDTYDEGGWIQPLSISNEAFAGGNRNRITYSFETNISAEGWMEYDGPGDTDGESTHESGQTSFSGVVDGLPVGTYLVRARARTDSAEAATGWIVVKITSPF